jgi:hypothetical protein
MEWAASAMEMSVIAARNVANLAALHWEGEKRDQKYEKGKEEELKLEL